MAGQTLHVTPFAPARPLPQAPRLPVLWRLTCAALGLVLGLAATASTVPAADESGLAWVDEAGAAAADADLSNWLLHGRTYDEQRYSPLAEIDTANVGRLSVAWVFEPGTKRGLEATPLVSDGVLYATGTWSVVYALDAATGEELWTYDPRVPREKGRDACCDVVNRGVALWKGRVYVGTLDGRLVCLDARDGTLLWETPTTDQRYPYTITGAPRVVKDKVLIGNGGAEFGVRGYFSAYDANSGELAWRFFTVPASKDGPHEHAELEAAAATWSAESLWDSGLGGTVWDSMSYDPELDLLYVGTGNASVYNRELRSPGGGDNLYLASILALRPDDGELVWHYQTTPGEQWDFTATQHMVLASLDLEGGSRDVLMQAPKNGFFYVLDRRSGELLSAEPFVDVSWATHVDLASGRPVERVEADWSRGLARVTPGIAGGHNWHPMSFSRQTGLVYIPTFHAIYDYLPDPDYRFVPNAMNTSEDWGNLTAGIEGYMTAVKRSTRTALLAWDPVRGAPAWRVEHVAGVPAGVLSTAGGLVFQGLTAGGLAAYDASSGDRLWRGETGTGVMAPPISYRAGGEQFVAVLAGIGGSAGGHFTEILDTNVGRIVAFKLDGAATPPSSEPRPPGIVQAPPADAALVDRGRELYSLHCGRCHGTSAESSGLYPDLRHSAPEIHEIWREIVLDGAFAARGMASFADLVDADDVEAIHAYVNERAHAEQGWLAWLAETIAPWVTIPAGWLSD